jgi:hypothetical protein
MLKEERRVRGYENRVQENIWNEEELAGGCRNCIMR